MYLATYALCFLLFISLSFLSARIRRAERRVAQHIIFALVCTAVTWGSAYIFVHIFAVRTYVREVLPLKPLLRSDQKKVYVLAISVKEGESDKKDLHVVSVNKAGAPALVVFSEGEARLLPEQRSDGVIEKRTTKIEGVALWFSSESSWDEYIIRVPERSIERPKRIENIL